VQPYGLSLFITVNSAFAGTGNSILIRPLFNSRL